MARAGGKRRSLGGLALRQPSNQPPNPHQVPLGGLALRPTAPSAVYKCSVGGLVLLNTVCRECPLL